MIPALAEVEENTSTAVEKIYSLMIINRVYKTGNEL